MGVEGWKRGGSRITGAEILDCYMDSGHDEGARRSFCGLEKGRWLDEEVRVRC